MNLIFIGPRGVGKSKISRKLSKLTGMSVISTDMIAVYELGGISISEYIKTNNGNWQLFRDLEFSILKKIENCKNIILDCGGGIIFDIDENGNEILSNRKVSILKTIGKIIQLDGDHTYLVNKVTNDPSRPSLSSKEPYSETLRRRSNFYRSIADYSTTIDMRDPDELTKRILSHFPILKP